MTIYVKKEEEKVYNALMLDNLSVPDLVHAVSLKAVSFGNRISSKVLMFLFHS